MAAPRQSSLATALVAFCRERGLLSPKARNIVALSGGPDSCALLLALVEAADSGMLPRPVGVAHFHHGLRGRDADEDAAFSAALAARFNLPCVVGIGTVPAGNGIAPNDAARRARYAFLEEAAEDLNANTITTAHTADDQSETVLLRVLRGTGVDGLGGIPVTRPLKVNLTIERPLLFARRSEIEAYCRDKGVTARRDPTNEKERYARARLRARLPDLARDFNSRLPQALSRLAENAARDSELLQLLANDLWLKSQNTGEDNHPGSVSLRKSVLRDAPAALRRRVLLRALRPVSDESISMSEAGTDYFVSLLEDWIVAGTDAFAADLPGGLIAQGNKDILLVKRRRAEPILHAYDLPLTLSEVTRIPEVGLILKMTEREPGMETIRRRRSPVVDITAAGDVAPLCLRVRSVVPGDRIAPLGMNGKTRLVRDILAEAGVPEAERAQAPVVYCADTGEILWLVGFAQSESTRVGDDAGFVLRLRAERDSGEPC